jgi:L-alanine-DL-glutamate epimerase-like enolase superfamily enzyme
MDILSIDWFRVKLKLRVPTVVAYGGSDEEENIIFKVTASNGVTGWGNAAPDTFVTGETLEEIYEILEDGAFADLFKGRDIYLAGELEELLLRELADFPSIRAGLSIAFWDTLSRALDTPFYRLLGQARESIPTSITISLLPLEESRNLARHYKKQGFFIPKIKLGGNLEEDMARIAVVSEEFGEDVPLRLDANQSYSAQGALELLDNLQEKGFPVELLEQPTPARYLHCLKQVTEASPVIPIMADESALNSKDILYLAELGAAHLVNIKLMKCGGVDAARQANHVARAAGLSSMVGCMDESVISIAAALAVCLSNTNIHYADLDGHVEIENDPASGGVRLDNGVLYPVEEPGLGVTVKF